MLRYPKIIPLLCIMFPTLGCDILEYEQCEIRYSISSNTRFADVVISAKIIGLPKKGVSQDAPEEHYKNMTTLLPKAFSRMLGVPDYSSSFPEFEKLPGLASFAGKSLNFPVSILGAFEGWNYSISGEGKQFSFSFTPTDSSKERTPWDTLRLSPQCKVISHNADSVDKEKGDLVWNIDRGNRKEKILFVLEDNTKPKSGGW